MEGWDAWDVPFMPKIAGTSLQIKMTPSCLEIGIDRNLRIKFWVNFIMMSQPAQKMVV